MIALIEQQAVPMPPVVIPKPTIGAVREPMRLPKRLQRSRKRGAKLPDGVVYVGRPTLFGNPFRHERFGHARSVLLHDKWLEASLSDMELEQRGFCPAEIEALHRLRERIQRNLIRLRGKNLACWCPTTSRFCHADTLLRLANERSI
jgi:hypothetical protein